MIKKLVLILVLVIISAVCWMGYSTHIQIDKHDQIELAQGQLSQLLSSLDGQVSNIIQPTVVVYFNSECQYCQQEIRKIGQGIQCFKQYQILFVSHENSVEAMTFLGEYNLENYYLSADPQKVISSFSEVVPQTLIYQNGLLMDHFKGNVSIDVMLKALKNE